MSIEKEKSNYKQLFMDYCKDKIKNLGNITVDEEIMEDSYINDTKILYVLPNVRGCEYVNVLRDDEGGAIWVSPEGNIVLEAGGMASANDDIVELKFTAIDKEYYEEILKYWSEYYFDEMMEIVKKCDKVLFINNKTIEVGKHEDLINSNKLYKEIIEISKNKIIEDEEI